MEDLAPPEFWLREEPQRGGENSGGGRLRRDERAATSPMQMTAASKGEAQLGAQFFDVLFDGHRRHLLMFEKDDDRGRGDRAGSRSAERDRTAAGGGAEMRQHFGGTARP